MAGKRDDGFPKFEHGQWTFEGEIERLGAFASGARRAKGAKRWVAVFIAIAFIAPVAIGAVAFIAQLAF